MASSQATAGRSSGRTPPGEQGKADDHRGKVVGGSGISVDCRSHKRVRAEIMRGQIISPTAQPPAPGSSLTKGSAGGILNLELETTKEGERRSVERISVVLRGYRKS